YQAVLQKNLLSLAAIADAQPLTPQLSPNSSQASTTLLMPANTIPHLANTFMQPGRSSSGQKLPFQLNSIHTLHQQQQQQLLQFRQQQQLQAQMGIRPEWLVWDESSYAIFICRRELDGWKRKQARRV
ncbi:hypothetical protein Tco_0667818, partial [Tanacetum coccineum]